MRENNSMRANRDATTFAVNGTQLNFSIHIDGIALGPYFNPQTGDVNLDTAGSYSIEQNYERNVFYSPLSSYHLYSIPASRLRDPEFSRVSFLFLSPPSRRFLMNFRFNIYAFEESHTSSTFRRYATQYMNKASFIYFIYSNSCHRSWSQSFAGRFPRDATVYLNFMIYVPCGCRATA